MTRYFLDTNIIVALTFSHDRWSAEAERLLHGQNTLFASEFIVYEYCARKRGDPSIVSNPQRLSVDPQAEHGVFGAVLNSFRENVERNIPMYDREIDLQRYEGLSFEKILTVFFDNIEVRRQAKPYFVRYFQEYFASREVTPRNAKRCVAKLRDRVLYDAKQRKAALVDSIKLMPSTYDKRKIARRMMDTQVGIGAAKSQISAVDAQWLLDAIGLAERGVVDHIVTADKGDVVQHQQQLNSLFNVSVLYILDEFHNDEMRHRNSQFKN